MKKKLLALVLVGVMSCLPFLQTFAETGAATTDVAAETDTTAETGTDTAVTGGYRESDLDWNTPVYAEEEVQAASETEIPSAFPGGISAVSAKYPEPGNQNPYGTCWAFSSIGLAEYDLINKGFADRSINLSELQLAYFTYNFEQDPLGGTKGDVAKYYNENASVNYLNKGGTYQWALRRLSQWSGPVNEKEVPYSQASASIKNGLDSQYAYGYDVAHLENAYEINIRQNQKDVKQQIMEHGAAGVMYYHGDSSMGWNDAQQCYTYYDINKTGGSHAVMIVGWDDQFSKDSFISPDNQKPSQNGAWLIRNSWGFTQQYFWMSYESASLSDTAWIFDFGKSDNYDNNYQLDGGLESYQTPYTTAANVFTVPAKEGVVSEKLKAVSLSCSKAAKVGYKIEIYTDLTNERDPLSGTLQETATTTGTTAYAGYYTVPLKNTVTLQPGSTYAVVVTLNQPALDAEDGWSEAEDITAANPVYSWERRVSLYNQKSLYLSDGKFQAAPAGNFRIKAFTDDMTTEEPTQPDQPGQPEMPDDSKMSLSYQSHVQTYGWQEWKKSGEVSGTSGQSKRVEALRIKVDQMPYEGEIRYTAHVQTYGWQDDPENPDTWKKDGEMSGTSGESKRLEAIKIKLTGEMEQHYDVYYRVHSQEMGWLGWAKNGEAAGTSGYSYRMEALQIVLLKKGSEEPAENYGGILSLRKDAMAIKPISIHYQSHVQTYGWQSWVSDGALSGTSGQSKRLEGIRIELKDKDVSGSLRYTTHVQTYGWQGDPENPDTWKKEGEMAGTSGQYKRLEAFCLELTGNLEEKYDVYYRTHVQKFGWLGWAKNGEKSGTAGYSYRMEALQIVLVKKGDPAPAENYGGIQSKDARAFISN